MFQWEQSPNKQQLIGRIYPLTQRKARKDWFEDLRRHYAFARRLLWQSSTVGVPCVRFGPGAAAVFFFSRLDQHQRFCSFQVYVTSAAIAVMQPYVPQKAQRAVRDMTSPPCLLTDRGHNIYLLHFICSEKQQFLKDRNKLELQVLAHTGHTGSIYLFMIYCYIQTHTGMPYNSILTSIHKKETTCILIF